ncbi:MAG: tetratricopeptide repeat protein [Leptolyngbya sp. IPPAS B-1204]
MTETTVEALFDQGLERYRAGEDPASLIPLFKEVCDRTPKSSSAWTCLAWLYLLDNKPSQAYKAAQKAVKLNPQDPQARINLAMAMLETAQKASGSM